MRTAEKNRERNRLYRLTYPEKVKASRLKWVAANIEKRRDDSRRWYAAHSERIKEAKRQWRAANLDKSNEQNMVARLKRFYGLTTNDYDAMLKAQGGKCAGCKQQNPDGRRLAVDHDHATGHVRGLLCTRCNTTAGRYSDSPEALSGLLRYIKKHSQLRLALATIRTDVEL